MADTMNVNPEFSGRVVQTAGVLEMGERVITTLADLPILATDQNISLALGSPQSVTISLPPPAALSSTPGARKLRFFDKNGDWGAYPVTFSATGGALIDGVPSVTVSQPNAEVVFEWRGTGWHANGIAAFFGGLGGGFGVDLLPVVASADDDEFNAATLQDWTVTNATVVAGEPVRGGAFVGPAQVRYSQTLRSGWLLVQPSSDGNVVQFHKPLSSPLTQGTIYCRFSMDSNAGVGPDSCSFALTQSSAGVPDLNNRIVITLVRSTTDNSWTLAADRIIASVYTSIYTATVTSLVQPVDHFQISRLGTNFYAYAGSTAAGMKYLGTFASGALNPDRIVFTMAATGAPPSLLGLDYVRRLDDANPTI